MAETINFLWPWVWARMIALLLTGPVPPPPAAVVLSPSRTIKTVADPPAATLLEIREKPIVLCLVLLSELLLLLAMTVMARSRLTNSMHMQARSAPVVVDCSSIEKQDDSRVSKLERKVLARDKQIFVLGMIYDGMWLSFGSQMDQLSTQLAVKGKIICGLEEQLDASKAAINREIGELRSTNEALEQDLLDMHNVQRENEEFHAANEQCWRYIASLEGTMAQGRNQVSAYLAQLEEAGKQAQQQKDELERLTEAQVTSQKSVEVERKAREQAVSDGNIQKSKLEKASKQVQDLEAKLETVWQSNDRLCKDVTARLAVEADQVNTIQSFQRKLEGAANRARTQEAELQKAQASYKDVMSRLEKAGDDIMSKHKENTELRKQVKTLEAKAAEQTQVMAVLEAQKNREISRGCVESITPTPTNVDDDATEVQDNESEDHNEMVREGEQGGQPDGKTRKRRGLRKSCLTKWTIQQIESGNKQPDPDRFQGWKREEHNFLLRSATTGEKDFAAYAGRVLEETCAKIRTLKLDADLSKFEKHLSNDTR